MEHQRVAYRWRVKPLLMIGCLVTLLVALSGCGSTPGAATHAPAGTATATIDIPARDATAATTATAVQQQVETAVATWNLNMTESSGDEYYETPLRAGTVRIVQANTPYLTVQANDGTLFTFNVLTRQWERSQPTGTPTLCDISIAL